METHFLMKQTTLRPKRARGRAPQRSLGPISNLESHLPDEWWRKLFNAIYVKTDGDVVENAANTTREIELLLGAVDVDPDQHILDLCCGQGRHVLELARQGFRHVTGVDRSRYLVRLARKRAAAEKLDLVFKEGDARAPRLPDESFDLVTILGNSFGYFADKQDDEKVLGAVGRLLRQSGTLVLDLTDGAWTRTHFEPRSWEWIDAHHFVCRERSLAADGERLISREVVVHDEMGVLADQFYAERLYEREQAFLLLERCGFRNPRFHGQVETQSERNQDLGMMAQRMLISADAPLRKRHAAKKRRPLEVTVLLGDPRLPDMVKREGHFNDEDMETIRRLQEALGELDGYTFHYLDNHATLSRDLARFGGDLVLNLCDEGFNNDPFKELHVTAALEMLELKYTGAGPQCLAACYDKGLVRAVAAQLDIPVPLESYVRPNDQGATLPSIFPAILKPNFGDSSQGITKDAVVHDKQALLAYLESLRTLLPDRPVLVQEFLSGNEYSVGMIGNPGRGLMALPILEVDYSGLETGLPRILGYESKWHPDSPYWSDIGFKETTLSENEQARLVDYSSRLFERLGCRDYARFDFRTDAEGTTKLLEVNPNPGWCWDGKLNLMAANAGMRYPDLLGAVLQAAVERAGGFTEQGRADAA